MKKLVIAFAALLLAVNANAQFGIVAGVTSASTDLKGAYSDIVETQSVSQYHAGLVLKLNLPLGLSLQPGVVYNMKGETLASQIATEEVNITTKTGYLEVPVRLAWQLNLGPVAPFVFAEPFLGYAINTETTTKFKDAASQTVAENLANTMGVKLNTSNDDPDKWVDRNRLNYGVGVGAGLLLFKKMSLSVKYFWDFGALYSTDEATGEKNISISAEAVKNQLKDNKASGIAATLSLYF